jgi:hypothetical protein
MRRKRYNPEEYPCTANGGDRAERDANGHAVRQLSQLPGVFLDSDDGANWAGYVDPDIPWHIRQMQRNEAEQIDHLFSHINDRQD